MNRYSRKSFILLTLAAVSFPVAFDAPVDAARSIRPKFHFSETFGDIRTRENVMQRGRLQAEAVMSMSGVSLKKIGAKTPFFFGIGTITMAGTLGDDPKYRPGKKSIRIRDGGRDLRLEWNRRRLLMTLTVVTERGEPGAFAETFMPSPDGPIEGDALSFTSFGDKASRLEIAFKGEKTTRGGLRKVRLTGSGDTDCGCG